MGENSMQDVRLSEGGMALGKLVADFGGRWVDAADDHDDRVRCEDCACKMEVAAVLRFPSEQFEKVCKNNLKPMRWMFSVAKIKNGRVTVPYRTSQCTATKLPPLPIPHRCQLYRPKASEELNWLDDEPPATPAAGAQRADQARDVGAGVPAGGPDRGDPQWWG